MLTVHHLGKSQSERIVWLCEELEIPYALKIYDRAPLFAPPEYKALHPIGAAPVITDGDIVLAESGAVVDYILARYGGGRLTIGPDRPGFADYLYWLHFANGTLQPAMGRSMMLKRSGAGDDNPVLQWATDRLDAMLGMVEARLGEAPYLAGDFSAGDIMTVFSLSTMRYFLPLDLAPYPNIRAYLHRIGERPAYRRAMQKGDPGMELLLS